MTWFRIALATLVTLVWGVGYALAYLNGTDAPRELSALMAIVLGVVFGSEVKDAVRRRLNGDRKEPADETEN